MAFFDRFKKKEIKDKREEKKKPPIKVVPKSKKEKPSTEKIKPAKKVIKKEYSQAYKIIKWPIVTEKSTSLEALNCYVFRVVNSANKPEIKKAVQDLYGVSVTGIKIIKVPGKKRRLGRHEGWHSGYKKALVTLARGENIEIVAR